ncbi:transcriptional regulator [Nonomuraea sp. PA05]|uniref:helix-turn-helix domain-containing protein n=1 Tax=Nonomuraea sp. PA05 TaxID=2604466 RepID=UPI0011D9E826|nr:helix-turn-helix domain-containing protein [Nonomuraea sp. PA05]TYB71201.1 transcriptional regulator [Nonomuraea sp. PA05]
MEIRPRVRIVGAERHQLAQHLASRYQAGESVRALSLAIGRSYGFVHTLLEEASVELRHRGGNQRSRPAAAGAAK